MPKVLILTNDFPPRRGGIQSFVHALASRLPAGQVVVYAPAWDGAAEFDARQPFPVVRHPTSLMLPVPSVARRARAILREHGCDTVLFGAAAPLGLLAPGLRRHGEVVGLCRVDPRDGLIDAPGLAPGYREPDGYRRLLAAALAAVSGPEASIESWGEPAELTAVAQSMGLTTAEYVQGWEADLQT